MIGPTRSDLLFRLGGHGFPAPAGIDPRDSKREPPMTGFPRARGDRPALLRRVGDLPAVSPRPRGSTRARGVGGDGPEGFPAPERMILHFTPTYSSWMNLIERFFRDLMEDAIRPGSFQSVRELTDAIESYLAARNLAPKRYVWKAGGAEILAKIQRSREALVAVMNS